MPLLSENLLNFLTSKRLQPLTNSLSQRLGLLFLGLAVAEVCFLSSLASLDAAFAGWVETHRSCELDYVITRSQTWPLPVLVALGMLFLLWLGTQGRWAEAWHALLVVILGGFLSELLKTGFERARPSVLPPLLVGNSFPSGHAAGALLIAGTLSFLLVRQRWTAWVKIGGTFLLAGLVSVTIWQRLYLGHHWLSDILGSFLLVSAWLCFVLPRPACLQVSRGLVFACAVLLAAYQVFYFVPLTRFTLPSVITSTEEPVFTLSFGEVESQSALQGAWGDLDWEPAGPFTWMERGEASITVRLPEHQAYTLKLAVRPFLPSKGFACFPFEVRVNQQYAKRLLLYRGWREYALRLDPHWLVPGPNAITFQTGTAFPDFTPDPRTVAFHHLSLFAAGR
ncbi:MAG: phosphatase PAP2 family protein [Deltaproteobacteria bacterium]|nr:phosphatase PAP2 family protein [Deltaproteobacteria bacterium]